MSTTNRQLGIDGSTILHMTNLLTVSQAAEICKRQPSSIRRAIHRGTLKAEKVGTVWIILRSDLNEYIANPPKPGPKPDITRAELDAFKAIPRKAG
jgi:excisionase family DNA binding protein